MIPPPPGPGDIPPTPEGFHPVVRGGGEPTPLVTQALDEIEVLKRTLGELVKRLDALERRVAALEAPAAR